MVWDTFSPIYDISETIYNKDVYLGTGKIAAEYVGAGDIVLECACGTGAISRFIAPKCKRLIATDMSKGMLREAEKNLAQFANVSFYKADITALKCSDNSFDKVIAGNVIHLLDDPKAALAELVRVCKHGGKVIVPTYINSSKPSQQAVTDTLRVFGVDFKSEFDFDSYKAFFAEAGYENVEYRLVEGRMNCAIAVITKA